MSEFLLKCFIWAVLIFAVFGGGFIIGYIYRQWLLIDENGLQGARIHKGNMGPDVIKVRVNKKTKPNTFVRKYRSKKAGNIIGIAITKPDKNGIAEIARQGCAWFKLPALKAEAMKKKRNYKI